MSNHAPLTMGELERAGAVLGRRCGLRFDQRNRDLLEQGILRAAAAEREAPARLLDRLDAPGNEAFMQTVLRHVTIGETYLFRHPEHFDLLREQIAPDLMRRQQRLVRAWSAGCASGEEAYSIASTLKSSLSLDFQIQVLGTDINQAALQAARQGRFGTWSVRGGARPPSSQFIALEDGGLQATPSLRSLMQFAYLNLRDPLYPSLLTATQGLDVIFCRNVLVYFFPEAAAAVVERLAGCLAEGGYLVLSALDTDFARPIAGLEEVRCGQTSVLRRSATRRTPARVPRITPTQVTPPTTVACPQPPVAAPGLSQAKAAADAGDLEQAVKLARQSLAERHTPEGLHLLALVLAERGEEDEALVLLRQAVAEAPDYALGHLTLGLRGGGAIHFERALALVAGRRDDELLPGPDRLPVSWVRKIAQAGVKRGAAR